MIKLFEEYSFNDVADKLISKIENFLEELSLKSNVTHRYTKKIMIHIEYNGFVVLEILITREQKMHIYNYDYEHLESKQIIRDYLFYKISEFFEESIRKKNIDYIPLEKLTSDIVNKINLSKEDFEIFKDTERFGL